MIYLNNFDTHASYEEKLNVGGIDFKIPNVSYCNDVKDVHFNPYNFIKFYVGNITGTTPKTVKIYTDTTTSIPIQVSKGNKWYSYVLPKDKGLYKIEGGSVKKVVVKANITTSGETIIPSSTVEASFKGSNTSKVTNMTSMFDSCRALTSLDLSSFNTSNVTDMFNTFYGCSNLTSLDLSSFDTSNVTRMLSMFEGCVDITSLDISSFNTSNVINMGSMFYGCSNLTSLDLRNFNTSNVTNMSGMFQDCTSLTSLTLSNFDTSKVTDMGMMFNGCSKLKTIIMKGCSEATIGNIRTQLNTDGITGVTITQ